MNQNYDNQSPMSRANSTFYETGEQDDIKRSIVTRSLLVAILGLCISIASATVVGSNYSMMYSLVRNNSFQIIMILELVAVIGASIAIAKNNMVLGSGLFIGYAILNGITLTIVFLAYDMGTVRNAFVLSVLLFATMTAIGYFTKLDLTKIGSCCGMALIGVILVSIANLFFFHSSGLELVMDYVVVLLFVGITAYDMQRMKKMSIGATKADINRIAVFTGMNLYLDFINVFLRILRIMGKRK